MIPNTDSIRLVYSKEHIRVNVYLARGQATMAEVGFDSLESALRYFREAAPKHTADEAQSVFPRLCESGDQG